jgi:hypothetical protein
VLERGERKRTLYGGSRGETTAEGSLNVRDVPAGRPLRLCASAAGFLKACRELELRETPSPDPIELKLERGNRYFGRSAVIPAEIYVVDGAGRDIARISVEDDGTFSFTLPPEERPEYAVIVSPTTPLFVQALPPSAEEAITIAAPAAPARSFHVDVPQTRPAEHWILGLWIGSRYIPRTALMTFESMRNHAMMLNAGTTFDVTDIFETEPIFVAAMAHPCQTMLIGDPRCGDPFPLPQYRSLPRVRVVGHRVTIP